MVIMIYHYLERKLGAEVSGNNDKSLFFETIAEHLRGTFLGIVTHN